MPIYDKKSVKEVQDYLDAIAKIPGAESKAVNRNAATTKAMKAAWDKLGTATKVIVDNIKEMAKNTEEVDMYGEKLSKSFMEIRDASNDLAHIWDQIPELIKKAAKTNSDWGKGLNNIVSTHEKILESSGDHTKFTEKQLKAMVKDNDAAQKGLDIMLAEKKLMEPMHKGMEQIVSLNDKTLKSMLKQKKTAKALAAANKIAGENVEDMYQSFKDALNPMSLGLIVVGLIAKTLTTMVDDAIELNSELGTGLLTSLKNTDHSIQGIFNSLIGVTTNINKAGAATALMAGSLKAGENTALNINRAAAALNYGVTVTELAQIEETLFTTADMTREMAAQAVNATQAFALANDVAPKAVLEDMASNAEMLAKYSDGTAEGMAKAAVYAQKLGINLSKVSQIADNLLDLETSMTAEFEASVLLNRDLNFDRARTLALNNDIQGAMEDIISQIGGEAEFAKMNAVQRSSLASAIGVGADDLANMMKKGADAGLKDEYSKYEQASLHTETELVALTKATNGFLKTLILIVGAAAAIFLGKGFLTDFFKKQGKNFKNRRSTKKRNKKFDTLDKKGQSKKGQDLAKQAKKDKAGLKEKKGKSKSKSQDLSTKKMNDKLSGKSKTPKTPKIDAPPTPSGKSKTPNTPPSAPNKTKNIISQTTDAGKVAAAGAGKEGVEAVGKNALKKTTADQGMKITEKQVAKNLSKAGSKSALKFGAKKIPILGLLFAAGFAGSRAMKGDWTGAGLELLSGGASIFAGPGTVASAGIDVSLMARDMQRAGVIGGKAMGGPVTETGTYMVGELGPELVTLQKGSNVYSNDQISGAMRDGNASLADIGPLVTELKQLRIVMKDVATNTSATSAGVNRINVKVEA